MAARVSMVLERSMLFMISNRWVTGEEWVGYEIEILIVNIVNYRL